MEGFTRVTLYTLSLIYHWEAGIGVVGLNHAEVEQEDGSFLMTLKTLIALRTLSRSNVMVEMTAAVVKVTIVWKERGTVTVTVIVHKI